MPVIPVLQILRQEDPELEVSLAYESRLCLQQTNKTK
jgi:hypothetical protein